MRLSLFLSYIVVFAQKPVAPDIAIDNLVINERTANTVSVSFVLKNNGPGAFSFQGSPTTPIDDFQVSLYLSANNTLETGNLNGVNDLLIGESQPNGSTLNEGSSIRLTVRTSVNNPNYDAYKFIIVRLGDRGIENKDNNVAVVAYNFSFEPSKASQLPLQKPLENPNRPAVPVRKNGNNDK